MAEKTTNIKKILRNAGSAFYNFLHPETSSESDENSLLPDLPSGTNGQDMLDALSDELPFPNVAQQVGAVFLDPTKTDAYTRLYAAVLGGSNSPLSFFLGASKTLLDDTDEPDMEVFVGKILKLLSLAGHSSESVLESLARHDERLVAQRQIFADGVLKEQLDALSVRKKAQEAARSESLRLTSEIERLQGLLQDATATEALAGEEVSMAQKAVEETEADFLLAYQDVERLLNDARSKLSILGGKNK